MLQGLPSQSALCHHVTFELSMNTQYGAATTITSTLYLKNIRHVDNRELVWKKKKPKKNEWSWFTDLVERSDSDGHFDAVLAVHVWGFSPHSAAGGHQHCQTVRLSDRLSHREQTQERLELHADMDTMRSAWWGLWRPWECLKKRPPEVLQDDG